jgi:hypothetical protein
MAEFKTTFPVAADAGTIWGVLVDLARWSEWNTAVPTISGEAKVGSTLSMKLAMPGRPSANVTATLTDLEPKRLFRWHGNIASDRFFSGTREVALDEQPDGSTRVTHVETVTGLFYPVFRLMMGGAIQKHHENFNASLRDRAESVD